MRIEENAKTFSLELPKAIKLMDFQSLISFETMILKGVVGTYIGGGSKNSQHCTSYASPSREVG